MYNCPDPPVNAKDLLKSVNRGGLVEKKEVRQIIEPLQKNTQLNATHNVQIVEYGRRSMQRHHLDSVRRSVALG